MAANFKPLFWSKYCQVELAKDLVLANWCDYKFEKEFSYGDRLKIPGAVRPTVFDYEVGVDHTPERLPDNSQYLDIDHQKAFMFYVDDISKAQSRPEYLTVQFDEAKKSLAEAEDAEVGKLAKDALSGMKSTSTDISAETDPFDTIDAGLVKLYKNNVSTKEELAADLTPEHLTLCRKKLASIFTDNVEYIKRGAVGKYNQTFLRMSNNLYNDNTDDYEMIRTKKAIAVANCINKVETDREPHGFEDIVKGLNVFGCKLVRPKELYVIKVH